MSYVIGSTRAIFTRAVLFGKESYLTELEPTQPYPCPCLVHPRQKILATPMLYWWWTLSFIARDLIQLL